MSRDGALIEVEPEPLNLLMLLMRNSGQLLTKNDLIDVLWTGRIVTDCVLDNCVGKLRQVLGMMSADRARPLFLCLSTLLDSSYFLSS